MTLWEAIILGIVQGLTEFLPISSSAHLRIVGEFTSESDPGAAFTAITQIGTEAAVLLYFRHDIARIISHWFRALPVGPWKRQLPPSDPDARLGWLVILGSIPIGVGGLLLEDWIDTTFRNLYITVATLALFGILLGVADSVSRRVRTLDEMTYPHGIIYGFAQAMALIPGVSRSGGTITAGRFMGYTRQAAARYSFLLAIPAVLASGFYKLFGDVLLGSDESVEAEPVMTAIIVATVVAFAVGYLVIVAFLKIISRYSFMPFVIYRLILAGVVFYMLQNNIISAV